MPAESFLTGDPSGLSQYLVPIETHSRFHKNSIAGVPPVLYEGAELQIVCPEVRFPAEGYPARQTPGEPEDFEGTSARKLPVANPVKVNPELQAVPAPPVIRRSQDVC